MSLITVNYLFSGIAQLMQITKDKARIYRANYSMFLKIFQGLPSLTVNDHMSLFKILKSLDLEFNFTYYNQTETKIPVVEATTAEVIDMSSKIMFGLLRTLFVITRCVKILFLLVMIAGSSIDPSSVCLHFTIDSN